MSVLHALELEERVGRLWHRMVGNRSSWPHHPAASVRLDDIKSTLAVLFRGLGGDPGLHVTASSAQTSRHRLSWRQRLGMDEERLDLARRDASALALPECLDLFPDRELNFDLYVWLTAFFAIPSPALQVSSDPLQADLQRLARVDWICRQVLRRYPALAGRYSVLCQHLSALRPVRSVFGIERDVEALVVDLLGGPPAPASLRAVLTGDVSAIKAPPGYRPFLPVPLWGDCLGGGGVAAVGSDSSFDPQDEQAPPAAAVDQKRRRVERRQSDNANRDDPLILNRFEKILSFADMVNVNRAADDTDEEEARKAADDLDALTLSAHHRKAATRLAFDLDLPAGAMDLSTVSGRHLYQEWDYRLGAYHPNYCVVQDGIAPETGEVWQPDDETRRKIRMVQRQFQALRSRVQCLHAQADGDELDLEAVVRSRCDSLANGLGSDRLHMQRRPVDRDLAVSVLVDVSLSTDSWIENRRVLDVEKDALTVFSHALMACGDRFAIHTFTSRKRDWVRVEQVKGFEEAFGPAVQKRIAALKPGFYTRIGAAIRHCAQSLQHQPCRHRLLLVLTDGKPNDVDHYEGRYGLEDSRKAVQEARARGLTVFGVTIDRKAQSYFPHLFGQGHYAIVGHLAHLTTALPRLYRHLVAL